MFRNIASVVVILVAASLAVAQDGKRLEIKGKVESVTVYRGQALVTRMVDVAGPAGLKEVAVTELPARVVGGSVFAESADGVEIRSVLYQERNVAQDVREVVRKKDQELRDKADAISANQKSQTVLAEQRAYLDKLSAFIAPTATVEMTKGVLNADQLQKLTTFQFEQRQTIATKELELAKQLKLLQEELNVLQRERSEMAAGSSRVVREAVIFANFTQPNGKMRVRYLVDSATWFPSYNLRGERNAKQVTLEFNSSIQQMSGEDWQDVAMTLSTATPSLVSVAPMLDPMTIALAHPGKGGQAMPQQDAQGYNDNRDKLKQRQFEAEQSRNTYAGNKGGSVPDFNMSTTGTANSAGIANPGDVRLNELAQELQVMELNIKDMKQVKGVTFRGETVSVTYQLPQRTSLPSRADQQLIQVASMPVKAEFYKLAVPVLTPYVYDQATITNDGKMVLLAGPIDSYLAGQFVGNGTMATVAVGETFTAGFGIDSSLRASRELVEKTETVQGGNRVLNFNYHLAVENFGAAPVAVRLMDRLPTTKDNDLKITLASGPTLPEVSKDESYQQKDRKAGMLRWDVEVPPQAIGPKAKGVDYQFKLEYDKQMTIAGMPVTR